MKLTSEQQAVVDAATDPSHPRLTVIGYAGAAKTTTMLAVAKAKDGQDQDGSAFFFNKAMADEMKEKILDQQIVGLTASTLHSLAYRTMRQKFGRRVGDRLIAREIASQFKYKRVFVQCLRKPITPVGVAYIAMRSLSAFCQSGSAEMEDRYLRAGDHEIASFRQMVRQALRRHSYQLVEAVFDMDNGMPMPHDVYLKKYVEEVAAGQVDGPLGQYLIGDEFQDSNGVTMKLMRTMSARGRQIVVAGDPYQQIYQWRGSVDAMSRLETDRTIELTQSFRFGQPLADLASDVLGYLGATVRLRGNPAVETQVSIDPLPEAPNVQHAIICRSNITVVSEALKRIQEGQTCYVPKAKTLVPLIEDLADLRAGRKASRTELRIFKDVGEFMAYVDDAGAEYKTTLKMVEDYGAEQLLDVLSRASGDVRAPTVILTAHGSKGLQFPHVTLADDFPDSKTFAKKPASAAEELRLLYVAATRAQYSLDISRVPVLSGIRMGLPMTTLYDALRKFLPDSGMSDHIQPAALTGHSDQQPAETPLGEQQSFAY